MIRAMAGAFRSCIYRCGMRSERSPMDLRNAETSVISPTVSRQSTRKQRGHVAVVDVEHRRRDVGFVFNARRRRAAAGRPGPRRRVGRRSCQHLTQLRGVIARTVRMRRDLGRATPGRRSGRRWPDTRGTDRSRSARSRTNDPTGGIGVACRRGRRLASSVRTIAGARSFDRSKPRSSRALAISASVCCSVAPFRITSAISALVVSAMPHRSAPSPSTAARHVTRINAPHPNRSAARLLASSRHTLCARRARARRTARARRPAPRRSDRSTCCVPWSFPEIQNRRALAY